MTSPAYPRLHEPSPVHSGPGRWAAAAALTQAALLAAIALSLRPATAPNAPPPVEMAFLPPALLPEPEPEPEINDRADPAPSPPEALQAAPEPQVAETIPQPEPTLAAPLPQVAVPSVPVARPKPPRPRKTWAVTQAAAPAPVAQAAPPPAAEPARLPSAGQGNPAAEASFEARIRAAVQAQADGHAPLAVRTMQLSGRAGIAFTYQGGGVTSARVAHSAGAGMLDDAALAAVQRAAYPQPTPEIGARSLALLVWVQF